MAEVKNIVNDSEVHASGDVHIGDNITNVSREKPVFSVVNLDVYRESEANRGYILPRFTGWLVQQITGNKLQPIAVFSSMFGFDKVTFIKHLALHLVESVERNNRKFKFKVKGIHAKCRSFWPFIYN
jgi:hypothetical protein